MAPSWSCRRHALPCRCAHARSGAPCRSDAAFVLGHDTKLYRDSIHAMRALRAMSRFRHVACSPGRITGHVAALYRSLTALSCHTIVAPHPRYNALYHDSHPQRPDPRERSACPCARACRVMACIMAVSQALLRAIPTVSWPPGYAQASLPALPFMIQTIVL